MTCPYCGSEMRDGSVLCTACGRLTPEFERTYRRPEPTVGERGGGFAARGYNPDVSGRGAAGPKDPRVLLALVIGAILALGVLSLVIGSFLPADTTKAYREAIEEEYDSTDASFEDYDAVLEVYFDAYTDADEDAIRTLFPEALRGASIEDLDEWSFSYWETVQDYAITDVHPHSSSDAAGIAAVLDADVEQYVDVEVSVTFDEDFDTLFDFELVRIDGTWYLYEIW